MSKENNRKIDPNKDCKSGCPYKLTFKTGVHKDKKKELDKKKCRGKEYRRFLKMTIATQYNENR